MYLAPSLSYATRPACRNASSESSIFCWTYPIELARPFGRSRCVVRELACVSALYRLIVRDGPREDSFLFLPSFSFGYCEP
jgi:hypothetical protein